MECDVRMRRSISACAYACIILNAQNDELFTEVLFSFYFLLAVPIVVTELRFATGTFSRQELSLNIATH